MKKLLVLILVSVAVTAAGAQANGSAYSPGLDYGSEGVRKAGGDVRYVTLPTSRATTVAAIAVRGGRVVNSRSIRGFYGVPLVAYDGTTGGLSGDGETLVVSSYGPLPGDAGTTRFLALRAKTLNPYRLVELRGTWSFDALSPDGSRLYLVEHISAGDVPRYRVRAYDLEAGRLLPKAVIDRLVSKALMGGEPVTRASTADGRWAYTLYARKGAPFVHALDTTKRAAFCIDLPLRMAQNEQMRLRVKLRDASLSVRMGNESLADVDLRTLAVHRHES
ncbi:MAG TPA: hypothetical protein VEW90_10865 [Gaiellaceae bacterium]|nr:hypothetical protein [Gaiellaceae bacterium]